MPDDGIQILFRKLAVTKESHVLVQPLRILLAKCSNSRFPNLLEVIIFLSSSHLGGRSQVCVRNIFDDEKHPQK